MKRKVVSITLKEDLLKKLKEICNKTNRTLSNYIETVLEGDVKNEKNK